MGPKIPNDNPENGKDPFCKNKFQEILRDPSLNVINPDSNPLSVDDTPTMVMRCTAIVLLVETYATIPTAAAMISVKSANIPTVHLVHILETLQHV